MSRETAAPPRPAATLVLVRDTDRGIEVLLTRRPQSMRFMGGATVFPGGAVAPSDSDDRWQSLSARSPASAVEALGMVDPGEALALFICALREAFEEVGLAPGASGGPLLSRGANLLTHCLEHGVALATDEIIPAGRWVTPEGSPVRFDTYFFVKAVSAEWEPDPDPSEVDDVLWLSADGALAAVGEGRLSMAPPTISVLQRMRGLPSTAALIDRFSRQVEKLRPRTTLSQRLAPLIHVVLAPNPGVMTGPGTNTYVVGRTPAIVIDPAVADAGFLDEVCKVADTVGVIAVTHRHSDHTGGVAALVARTGAPVRAFGVEPVESITPEQLVDGQSLEAGSTRMIALHTPGHASDHLCFLMEGALFSGDSVLGEGTAVIAPPDGDMSAYLRTLERLSTLNLERIYPGHFRARSDPDALIAGYIDHRRARERAILGVLAEAPATLEEVVERVYVDTPTSLHPLAIYSALAHLEMAESEGRVLRQGDRWVLASGAATGE